MSGFSILLLGPGCPGGSSSPTDPCEGVTCGGHGACQVENGEAGCVCDLGYTGNDCETCDQGHHRDPADSCVADADCATEDPCLHGTCDDTGGVIRCSCDDGWTGDLCDACAAGWHDDGEGVCVLDGRCLPSTCSSAAAGTCEDAGGVITCACQVGYVGTYCEACDLGHHRDPVGACVPDADCATDDPCVHGTCDDTGGVIRCGCADGYGGETCDRCAPGWHVDAVGACALDRQCLPSTCSSAAAGACDDTGGVISCACQAGYVGIYCEACDSGYHRDPVGACVPDEDCTTGDPCVHGTCDDTGGVIRCGCADGYAGETCDRCAPGWHDDGHGACVLDETCLPGLCGPQGTCDDSSGQVVCTCDAAAMQCGLVCLTPTPAQDVDFRTTDTSGWVNADYLGQSFVPSQTGRLLRLDVHDITNLNGATSVTITIHPGGVCSSGPCSPALHSEVFAAAVGALSFTFSAPPSLVAGQEYTWKMSSTGGGYSMSWNAVNGFPGGRSVAVDIYDHTFTTIMGACPF